MFLFILWHPILLSTLYSYQIAFNFVLISDSLQHWNIYITNLLHKVSKCHPLNIHHITMISLTGTIILEFIHILPISSPQLAIKTGYDKFLSVALDGSISGRSEAIGAREEFQISFDDGFQVGWPQIFTTNRFLYKIWPNQLIIYPLI